MRKSVMLRIFSGVLAVLLVASGPLAGIASAAEVGYGNVTVIPGGPVVVETLPPTAATEPEAQPVPTDPMVPTVPKEGPISGAAGKNLTWNLDTDGVLTISGSGEMADFSGMGAAPWQPYNEQIVAVVIEPGVTTISNWAFRESKMESVVIPEGVTTIAETAFWNCEALRSITLPDSVTDVGATPFDRCVSLTGIWVGKGNKHYSSDGYGVLFDKNQTTLIKAPRTLTQYAIPKSVTRILGGAFCLCTALTDVTIPGSVESIDGSAFNGTGLTSVTIPASVTSIGSYAFQECRNLTGIYVDAANPKYSSDASGVLFDKNKTLLIQAPVTIAQYEIPDSVRTIWVYAFANCSGLESISIPDSVTRIEKVAFSGTALKQITIPGSVRNIGWGTFMNCSALQSVTFEGDAPVFDEDRLFGGVTATVYYPAGNATWTKDILQNYGGNITWKSYTDYSGLQFPASATVKALLNVRKEPSVTSAMVKRLEIGEKVEILEIVNANGQDWGRIKDGWIMMHYVDLNGNSAPNGGSCGQNLTWTFDSASGTLTISGTGKMWDYTQDASKQAPWSSFADQVRILVVKEGVTSIGDFAFEACSEIEEASFPGTLVQVGQYAFYRLTRPDGNVYHRPFWSTINQSVRQWYTVSCGKGNEGFPGWDSTKFVNIQPVTASGKSGDNVYWELREDGTMEFFGTGNMYEFWATASPYYELPVKSILIGEGITNIGMNIFELGSGDRLAQTLETVTIASTVKRVETTAFFGCQTLKTIRFTGDAPEFGWDCFGNVTATAYYPAGNATWTNAVMQDYEGNITWVSYNDTPGVVPETPIATGTVKVNLNVRKEPSVTSVMVKKLSVGEKVEIFEIVNANGQDWGRIKDGWIVLNYVDLDGSSTTTGGTCGQNLTWTFDKNTGVLTISGTGEMYDYDHDRGPWGDKVVRVVVESGVTSIGNYAFFFTDTLKTVTMADSVLSIGDMAFANCRNLSSADLPKNLVSIGWQTFWDTNIRSLYIPATVTRIGDGAFAGNHASKDITVAEGNHSYLVEDGILFTKNKDTLLYYPPAKADQQYVVPGEVRRIGERAFSGNEYLRSVEISEGTREIGWLGFEYCSNMASVTLPSTLTDIGSCAFIFTGLQEIAIPENVVNIGAIAFYYCTSLQKLTFQGDAPTFERAYPIVEDTFTNVNAEAYYPAGNATWTDDVMQNYGGNITWLPYDKEDTGHNPGTKWYSNSKEHWKKCSDCNHKVELAPHVPGPEATQYSAQRCLICDRTINNPKALDWMAAATSDPDSTLWATGYYNGVRDVFGMG